MVKLFGGSSPFLNNVFTKLFLFVTLLNACAIQKEAESVDEDILYTMPDETESHEGTWLQWVHEYQYGVSYRNRLDQTWVDMTKELVASEKVHLIVYNLEEQNRVTNLLKKANVSLTNVDFTIQKTDDVWVRDNGPIFVRDKQGNLVIEDWDFNGWGKKAAFNNCNAVPSKIAKDQSKSLIDLNAIMINEGGSVEIDGNGTLMACKSSILNGNRNPNMTQKQAENIFTKYLGIRNFIWLEGQAGLEITDQHIDGFARFGNSETIVTMENNDLLRFEVKQSDIDILLKAKNKDNQPYQFVKLPLTQDNVITTYGKNLGYQGSYCNYYVANTKVLVPIYNDPNDAVAIAKLKKLYPTRTVVGIDVRNLYENGGMIHCVTQQQPKP
ncbi:MAG: agmatine deiminase family protein [Arcicella sp.]|jgi:agmatine deiminase|nr:agmatine deiminase family protein [Arcicella sp.]